MARLRIVGKGSSSLLEEIKSASTAFHASELAIAHAIFENPKEASYLNISQLALLSDTSVASVVRFAKTMGYKGYPEFRMALVSEVTRLKSEGNEINSLDGGITVNDSTQEVIRKIALADLTAIQATAERLDVATVVKVVDAWENATTIGIFGLASSGYVAMDLQLKLNRLGKAAISWRDAHTAMTSISLLNKGDCIVAISHSGTTIDVVDVMKAFKDRGVTVILITNALRSSATSIANLVLQTSARETTFRSGATASRIAQLTVVDCLCVSLAQRNWSGTKTALDESRAAVGSRSGKKPSSSEQKALANFIDTHSRGGKK